MKRFNAFLLGTTSLRAISLVLGRDDGLLRRALAISGRMLGTLPLKSMKLKRA